MPFSYPTHKTNDWIIAGLRLFTPIIVIFIMTAVTEASDSLYLEYIQKSDSMFLAEQYDSSLTVAKRARDEAVKLYGEEDTLVARALYRMGGCNFKLSRPAEAEDFFIQSLSINEALRGPSHQNVADCLNSLADIAYASRKISRAESLYVRAASIREQLQGEDRVKFARSVTGMANIKLVKSEYPQALDFYYRALRETENAVGEQHKLYLTILSYIGMLQIRMFQNEEALAILQKTVALTEEMYGPRCLMLHKMLSTIGLIHRRYNEYETAIMYFERAVEIVEDSLGLEDYALAVKLLNLGKINRHLGNLREAEQYLLRYLDIMNKYYPGRELAVASAVTTLARIYYDRGDSVSFKDHFERARSAYDGSLNARYQSLPSELMNFSKYFRAYDGQLSLNYARHGFELRRNHLLSNYQDMSEADALRFSWYMREAASYYLSSYLDVKPADAASQVAVTDIIFASKGQVSDEIFERNLSLVEETAPHVITLRDSLGQAKMGLSAIYASRIYDDSLGGYASRRDSLLDGIHRMELRLIDYGSGKPRFREPHYITTKHVAENLPDGSVLVEYLRYYYVQRNPDTITARYLVAILKPGPVKPIVFDIGSADDIEKMISGYHLHMRMFSERQESDSELDREYYELASRLYNKIWKPIENEVSDCSLSLIAPDGALNLVSFAGLPDEKGKFLVEKLAVHYLSSGRDAIWLNRTFKMGNGLLTFGDPDYDASAPDRKINERVYAQPENITQSANYVGPMDLLRTIGSDRLQLTESRVTRLPATRNEVDQIVGFWKQNYSDTALMFLDKEATEDNLKRFAPGKRVIHIATHGYYSPKADRQEYNSTDPGEYRGSTESPLLQSGLFLAGSNLHGEMADSLGINDGILTAEEVSIMNLTGVEWVVLSACESGLGEIEAGEGVYGLRRAFQMAGARTVISSLWPVADKSTAEFMISLYKVSDQTLYNKMHQYQIAQIEKLRNHGYSDHPSQWAAFIATGDWR